MSNLGPDMSSQAREALKTIMEAAKKTLETMPMPLAELQPLISQWAHIKGIMNAASPVGQMQKTTEKVGEAQEVFQLLLDCREVSFDYNPEIFEKGLALELGDILVTICIQAEMQGFRLSAIIPHDINKYDENDQIREWDNIDYFVSELSVAVAAKSKLRIIGNLLSVYVCVQDAATRFLGMSAEECLEMTYEKIKARQGHLNEQGQFVKVES